MEERIKELERKFNQIRNKNLYVTNEVYNKLKKELEMLQIEQQRIETIENIIE